MHLKLLFLSWIACFRCSVAKSCQTLWDPHGPQHSTLPCPSVSPIARSDSCPLSQWCFLTISSSAALFSFCLQSLLTKVHLIKAMVLPVVTYGCESWAIKKVEHQIINAFEMRCWRRLSKVSWTARRSSLSILKEIGPEYSLDGLMLKLKLKLQSTWSKELTHWKRPRCWERWKAGEGDDRGWDGWMASLTWWAWVWVNCGSWWWTGRPGVLRFMGSQSRTRLSNWAEVIWRASWNEKVLGPVT